MVSCQVNKSETNLCVCINRFQVDIEAEPVGHKEADIILKESRLKAAMLANELRDKCVVRS